MLIYLTGGIFIEIILSIIFYFPSAEVLYIFTNMFMSRKIFSCLDHVLLKYVKKMEVEQITNVADI